MGMYDSIFLKVKCPFCNEVSEMECQTKELDCQLEEWRLGDNTNHPNDHILHCVADCKSQICLSWQNNIDGYRSGFGRIFELEIETPYGLVTGKYRIIQ